MEFIIRLLPILGNLIVAIIMQPYCEATFGFSLITFFTGCAINCVSLRFPPDNTSPYFQIRLNTLSISSGCIGIIIYIVYSLISKNYETIPYYIAFLAWIISGYFFAKFTIRNNLK